MSGEMGLKSMADLSLSNRNDPVLLKNSGMSVTPSTDLKPKPNRPISEVPRLLDKCENRKGSCPVLIYRLPIVSTVKVSLRQPDPDVLTV